MNRRQFLSKSTIATASFAAPNPIWPPTVLNRLGSFDFVFLTDTHIEPELEASEGCALCFKKIRSNVTADFAIQGGDHVFDASTVDRQRANTLFNLYAKTEQDLGLKVHHTIGNHDIFGVFPKSGVGVGDPGYGKQTFQDRIGPTYYSFDHKGYHFVVLDSFEITEDRNLRARIDATQLDWLKKDLGSIPVGTPIVITVHVPLLSGAVAYAFPRAGPNSQLVIANASEVISIFDGYNVLVVLQGHLHINEVDTFKGVPYVTCGAVSGNWWHGTHAGTPEGFTVVSLRNGKISWRYETYGFKSVDPQNT